MRILPRCAASPGRAAVPPARVAAVVLLSALLPGRPALAAGDAVTVSASANPTEVTVGQTFVVDVRVTAPAGTTFRFPESIGDDSVELRLAGSDGSGPSGPGTARYHGRSFALRDAAVPPITVHFSLPGGSDGEAASEPVPLTIVSLLPKDGGKDVMADIRGPLSVPVTAIFVGAAAALAAALTATILLFLRRRRPAALPVASDPGLPANEEAGEALDRLAAAGLIESGEYRTFYIALSEIAKRYLERRLEAPVLEMTTTEMAAFLRNHALGRDLAPTARDLAGAADHVKFARGSAQRAAAERHLAQVRELVRTLEQRLAARQEAADALRRTA